MPQGRDERPTPWHISISHYNEKARWALELEDFFDEELGAHIRLLAFHELGKDPERFGVRD